LDAYYANLFAWRVTPSELVLEFGNFYPSQGNRTQADFEDFDIRVVMNPDLLEQIIPMLQNAKAGRDEQRKLIAESKKAQVDAPTQ
jgi:hypothetical protein